MFFECYKALVVFNYTSFVPGLLLVRAILYSLATMHPLAQDLQKVIEAENNAIWPLLSRRGREIYFPTSGILGQTAEAKGCRYNATIGIALEDDGKPMHLPSLNKHVSLEPGHVYPYASSFGLQPLRETWQQMMKNKNPGLPDSVSLPVITGGLTGALSTAGFMFVDDGDELLVSDKYWGNYNLLFSNSYGGSLRTFNTFASDGLDLPSFAAGLQEMPSGKKIVLLNFPNNPSGYSPTKAEVEEMVQLLTEAAEASTYGMVVIIDDAYFGLVYEDGICAESLFAPLSRASDKLLAVKIDGATKEDYAWGHRVGCITFGCRNMTSTLAEALAAKAAGVVRAQASNVCHLSQSLLLSLYKSSTYAAEKESKYNILRGRYERVKTEVNRAGYADYFKPLPFNSGYFMCVQLADGLDPNEIRLHLLKQHNIGTIATGGVLRIAYSCLAEADIPVIFTALYNAVSQQLSPNPHDVTRLASIT